MMCSSKLTFLQINKQYEEKEGTIYGITLWCQAESYAINKYLYW